MTELKTLQKYWNELTPWNIYKVNLSGGSPAKLTNVDYTAGLPNFSADGSKILFLRQDFLISKDKLVGSYGRFFLMNPDGSSQKQLIPDDKYTPTLEYFDW